MSPQPGHELNDVEPEWRPHLPRDFGCCSIINLQNPFSWAPSNLTQVCLARSIEFFMFGKRITTLGRGQPKRDQSVSVVPDD